MFGRPLQTRALFPGLGAAAVVFLCLLAYQEAPENTFHFDDRHNILWASSLHLQELTPASLSQAFVDSPRRRPLAYSTFAIDWWRGGGEPRAFLQTNVAIHTTIALLLFTSLYLLLGSLYSDRDGWRRALAASLAAATWAVHPIQTQAVTYVVQRMASLVAGLMLAGLLAYLLARFSTDRRRRLLWGSAALLAFALALLTKENAIILPGILILAELGLVRRDWPKLLPRRVDLLWLAVPGIIVLAAGIDLLSGAGPLSSLFAKGYALRDFTMGERLLTQPRVILFHFSQLLWPAPGRFSLEHEFLTSTGLLSPPGTLMAWLLVVGWLATGVLLLRRQGRRHLGFFLLFVPTALAIESGAVPLEMVFEHRMYFPTMGLAGLLALGLSSVLEPRPTGSPWLGRLALLLPAVFLLGFGLRGTLLRVPDWKTEKRLAEASLVHAPGSARLRATLASVAYKEGDHATAATLTREALKRKPSEPTALELQGLLDFDRKQYESALVFFRRAMKVRGETPGLQSHLGECYLALGRVDAAIEAFERARMLQPDNLENNWNLAVALTQAERCSEALAAWERTRPLAVEAAHRRTIEKQVTRLRERCSRDP